MDTNLTRCRWLAVARATLAAAAAAATVFVLTLVLKRVDVAVPEARDAFLGLLGLLLVVTAGALDAKDGRDQAPDTDPTKSRSWHEHEGSFRGMVG